MALTPQEQFGEAVQRSHSVAVVFRALWSGDSLGSALALAEFIESFGKPVEIICQGFTPHPSFTFLKNVHRVQPTLWQAGNLVLKLNLGNAAGYNLAHEMRDGHVHITLTPNAGALDPNHLTVEPQKWKHDLIVTVDTPDLPALGALYTEHRDFFHDTPIINIDHDPANEHYGAVNLVDLRACATAEVIADLIEATDRKRLTPEVSTCLLTGLIAETKSFRTPNVGPRTLELAGRLITTGGRRAEIIERLFRTRSIESLRLWGRVLARLKSDRQHKIVWSLLSRADFIHAGVDETHLPDVIHELLSTAPEAEVVCILHEHPRENETTCALVSTERGYDALHLTAPWHPSGHRRLAHIAVKNTALPVLERSMIEHLKQTIATTR